MNYILKVKYDDNDNKKDLIYVGKTLNFTDRIKDHQKGTTITIGNYDIVKNAKITVMAIYSEEETDIHLPNMSLNQKENYYTMFCKHLEENFRVRGGAWCSKNSKIPKIDSEIIKNIAFCNCKLPCKLIHMKKWVCCSYGIRNIYPNISINTLCNYSAKIDEYDILYINSVKTKTKYKNPYIKNNGKIYTPEEKNKLKELCNKLINNYSFEDLNHSCDKFQKLENKKDKKFFIDENHILENKTYTKILLEIFLISKKFSRTIWAIMCQFEQYIKENYIEKVEEIEVEEVVKEVKEVEEIEDEEVEEIEDEEVEEIEDEEVEEIEDEEVVEDEVVEEEVVEIVEVEEE